jgi:acetylornithine/N-succinyldiaminopimelate aminotransferase
VIVRNSCARKLCDDNGLLLIFDEIQTGLGRTANSSPMTGWALPRHPDRGQALGGGFPVGAVLATAKRGRA